MVDNISVKMPKVWLELKERANINRRKIDIKSMDLSHVKFANEVCKFFKNNNDIYIKFLEGTLENV